MRILALTDLYPPHYLGGYELRCREMMEGLACRGHEVFILTSRWKAGRGAVEGNVYRLLEYDLLEPRLLVGKPQPDPFRLGKRIRQLKWAFMCRRNYRLTQEMVAALQPELVYAWHLSNVSIQPALAAQDQQLPVVFDLCDYWLSDLKAEIVLEANPLKRWYRAAMIGLGDFARLDLRHMLLCSPSLKQSYADLGFPAQYMTVSHRDIPSHLVLADDALPETTSEDRQMRLIYAGRLSPEKGVDVALRAVAHLVSQPDLVEDISLDIFGEGQEDYVRQLHDLVGALGLAERVRFWGKLERQALFERYTRYDALLFPSRWAEPFGMTIIEAMARGLPVIATGHGAAPYIISDGENGLLVPPDEPVALAAAIQRLVENPALARQIRRAGLSTVRQNYLHEQAVARVESYLQDVLQRDRAASTTGD